MPHETKGRRFQFRWLAGALQWTEWLAPEEKPGRDYPIVCCDPKTGRLVQRLNFMVDSQSVARLDYGRRRRPAWVCDGDGGGTAACASFRARLDCGGGRKGVGIDGGEIGGSDNSKILRMRYGYDYSE